MGQMQTGNYSKQERVFRTLTRQWINTLQLASASLQYTRQGDDV